MSMIGGKMVEGRGALIRSRAAATGELIEPGVRAVDLAQLDEACALAEAAFDTYRETSAEDRARFLEAIADAILGIGDRLVATVMAESGLPRARLEGERGRTVGQLRLFASVLREGSWQGVRIDPAQPDRTPLPRPDLRLRHVPLGPVAVFGASNFPLAFSVAGGDTASALAAGCPVIVKAHEAHLGTSVLIAAAVDAARERCGLPAGVFAMVVGKGREIGTALVADPRIRAVGFTGSRSGGTALMTVAAGRAEPIPVYAEMSSINPVILLPDALKTRGPLIAAGFVAALNLGAGQFCTNPGLLLAVDGPALDAFVAAVEAALGTAVAGTMLTPGIHAAYSDALARRTGEATLAGRGAAAVGQHEAQAHLFTVDADAFIARRELHEELFGPAALLVRCRDMAQLHAALSAVEGQLTAAIHLDGGDHEAARGLIPLLERKAGRVLVNGFGTGVEVGHAMVHGGPYPATSDGRSTSVGSLAIDRFLRPVCYQDMPQDLLPAALRDGNPLGLPRRVDGQVER